MLLVWRWGWKAVCPELQVYSRPSPEAAIPQQVLSSSRYQWVCSHTGPLHMRGPNIRAKAKKSWKNISLNKFFKVSRGKMTLLYFMFSSVLLNWMRWSCRSHILHFYIALQKGGAWHIIINAQPNPYDSFLVGKIILLKFPIKHCRVYSGCKRRKEKNKLF